MIADNKNKKVLRIIWRVLVYGFALAGFGIISAWAIFSLGLTKNNGRIDPNNRYLMEVAEMGKQHVEDEDLLNSKEKAIAYYKASCIANYYPYNANLIMEALEKTHDFQTVKQMIAAVEVYINQDKDIKKEYDELVTMGTAEITNLKARPKSNNAINWMNSNQWAALKQAIVKEKSVIDQAAAAAGIEPRLIVTTLIGEQIRLYNTNREVFKSYLGPVKVLVTETKFSMGVTGIKEVTAMRIENYLRDSISPFYISPKYEHILDFESELDSVERIQRLTDNETHYYSYLYAGIMLHQFQKQWERAGFDISYNAGILATLFNLGFNLSVPKAAPEIGGAQITIQGIPHTFGGLAFDFYYSGELIDEFPYQSKKFLD